MLIKNKKQKPNFWSLGTMIKIEYKLDFFL